jgi:hypothetical protein
VCSDHNHLSSNWRGIEIRILAQADSETPPRKAEGNNIKLDLARLIVFTKVSSQVNVFKAFDARCEEAGETRGSRNDAEDFSHGFFAWCGNLF